ncbi:MAG: hypothetical protein J6T48_01385 [Bacteroidales bacterium]|nr:hypothetical protein [Bacteroidales bacterium]
MRRLTILLITIATALQGFSQIKMPMGSSAEVEKFYKTTTYVVMKNEFMSDYNEKIKETIEKHWTITPYKFIKASEFEKLSHDDDKSFLMANIAYFDNDDTKFEFLILSLGGSKYKTFNDMPTLCAIPLCYYEDEDEDKYLYKLGAMLKHCQTHIEICHKHPELKKETILDYYMNNSSSPADKKLYLLKDEVSEDLRSNSNLKSAYPYEAEFVTSERIEELIDKNDDKALIALIINPFEDNGLQYCIKIIIDVKEGMIYYYDFQKLKKNTYGYITSDDLKKLSKQ